MTQEPGSKHPCVPNTFGAAGDVVDSGKDYRAPHSIAVSPASLNRRSTLIGKCAPGRDGKLGQMLHACNGVELEEGGPFQILMNPQDFEWRRQDKACRSIPPDAVRLDGQVSKPVFAAIGDLGSPGRIPGHINELGSCQVPYGGRAYQPEYCFVMCWPDLLPYFMDGLLLLALIWPSTLRPAEPLERGQPSAEPTGQHHIAPISNMTNDTAEQLLCKLAGPQLAKFTVWLWKQFVATARSQQDLQQAYRAVHLEAAREAPRTGCSSSAGLIPAEISSLLIASLFVGVPPTTGLLVLSAYASDHLHHRLSQ